MEPISDRTRGKESVILRGLTVSNATVFIEATEDFQDWEPLGSTVANGTGHFTFIDGDAFFYPNRFYRAYR